MATTSPSSVPLDYYNSVDYVVYGYGRSSVWNSTLREHFCLQPPPPHPIPGKVTIWSPESLHIESGFADDRSPGAEAESQILIDLSELRSTTPQDYEPPEGILKNIPDFGIIEANAGSLTANETLASDVPSSSTFLDDEEEGMVPLRSIYLENPRHEDGLMSRLQPETEAGKIPSVQNVVEVCISSASFGGNLTKYRLSRHQSPRRILFPLPPTLGHQLSLQDPFPPIYR